MALKNKYYSEEEYLTYRDMDPFERIVHSFATVSGLTSKIRVSRRIRAAQTTVDRVLEILKGRTTWEDGLSSRQIAEKIEDRGLSTVQGAIKTLHERGVIESEKRGRVIRYYLK